MYTVGMFVYVRVGTNVPSVPVMDGAELTVGFSLPTIEGAAVDGVVVGRTLCGEVGSAVCSAPGVNVECAVGLRVGSTAAG